MRKITHHYLLLPVETLSGMNMMNECNSCEAIDTKPMLSATSALRIFLTCALQETQELLENYQPRAAAEMFVAFSDSWDYSHWHHVVSLLEKLQHYIENSLRSVGAELCYGLSAIGAVQEGLVIVLRFSNNRFGDQMHVKLMNEHTLRAKLIVNGLIAKLGQDFELESLWSLAAEQVHRKVSLIRTGSTKYTTTTPDMINLTQQLLSKAVISVGDSEATKEKELLQLAARHFRLAAVSTLLGRNHAYDYAAETYQQAAELSRSAAVDGSLVTLNLWQTAVASMRLAGDMIAAHSDETSAKNDSQIARTVAAAKQLAKNARRIPALVDTVKRLRVKMEACKVKSDKCKTPQLIPTLSLMAEKMNNFYDAFELLVQALLQEEFDDTAAKVLQRNLVSVEIDFIRFQAFASQLCERAQSAEYYRTRAAETDSVLHLELRPLLRQGWTKAAEEMEQLAHLSASFLVDGKLDHIARTMHDLNDDFYDSVRGYVFTAETVLGSGIEYLDKARGAEVGVKNGRDPREAQMWRKAAECRMKEAQLFIESLGANMSFSTTNRYSPIISWRKQICAFVLAAEHLYCAYKYTLPSSAHSQPDAQRISALYKQLATLEILRESHAYQYPRRYRVDTCLKPAIIDCFIDHIERLSSTSTVVSADKSLRLERVCQIGYHYMHAVHARARSEPMWEKALAIYLTAASQGDYKVREATVYVLAAKKIGNHGGLLDSICPKTAWLDPASLSNDNATQSVETQMQSIGNFFEDINKTRLEASPFQALLQGQVDAYCLEDECERQVTLPPKYNLVLQRYCPVDKPWSNAKNAVSRWIAQQSLQLDGLYGTHTSTAERQSQIAFSKAAAQCYIEAAKNPHAGVVTALWHDAIEVAKLAELYVEQCEFATTVLKHYARAAYATVENDIELSTCWGKAASTARTALIYACKHVVESESLRCTFKHAELCAYACVAQRAEKTDLLGLYKAAVGKWEEFGNRIRRTNRLKGRAREAAEQVDQRLRQEAEEAEHIAHCAAHAEGTAPESVTDQVNNCVNAISQDSIAPAQFFAAPGVSVHSKGVV